MSLRGDAAKILRAALRAALPDEALWRQLDTLLPDGEIILLAVGKAAWQMARAAQARLGNRVKRGLVITKYGHVRAPLAGLEFYEAGHPLPDQNTLAATRRALEFTAHLNPADTVLLLLSGGGSALLELPADGVSLEELQAINHHLLRSGADIVEINTLRKRLSQVKVGRLAQHIQPARVFSLILSDVLGDRLDSIASGPACIDSTTAEDAGRIAEKYRVPLSPAARQALLISTPRQLDNAENRVIGNVQNLCAAAAQAARALGYAAQVLTTTLDCEARSAGQFLAAIGRESKNRGERRAWIAGGETIVHVTGKGMGGRNQELALAAAAGIAGLEGIVIAALGSDGSDGPTSAAGGLVDGNTAPRLAQLGISLDAALRDNNAYPALQAARALINTGATGTNVNDLYLVLTAGWISAGDKRRALTWPLT
jgi:hydroxypyruvate reductase